MRVANFGRIVDTVETGSPSPARSITMKTKVLNMVLKMLKQRDKDEQEVMKSLLKKGQLVKVIAKLEMEETENIKAFLERHSSNEAKSSLKEKHDARMMLDQLQQMTKYLREKERNSFNMEFQ